MNDAIALVFFAGLIGLLVYVANHQQRRNRVIWACQIYDAVKRTGRLNSAEAIGAERWLNLALLDRGMTPRYPFARLEVVPRKPDITVNVDKVLVIESRGTHADMPRPVTVEVVSVESNAPSPTAGNQGLVRRNS